VKEQDQKMKAQVNDMTRRFVKVVPPTAHAGVGYALRQAFRLEGELRCHKRLEELLAALD
jgi:hypothetical protein